MEWKVDREHGSLQMCRFLRNLTPAPTTTTTTMCLQGDHEYKTAQPLSSNLL